MSNTEQIKKELSDEEVRCEQIRTQLDSIIQDLKEKIKIKQDSKTEEVKYEVTNLILFYTEYAGDPFTNTYPVTRFIGGLDWKNCVGNLIFSILWEQEKGLFKIDYLTYDMNTSYLKEKWDIIPVYYDWLPFPDLQSYLIRILSSIRYGRGCLDVV